MRDLKITRKFEPVYIVDNNTYIYFSLYKYNYIRTHI